MQRFILEELKEVCRKIKDYPGDKSVGGGMVADTILDLVEDAILSRKEGILAMDEKLMLENMSDNVIAFKVEVFNLVLDGTDPKLVEQLGLFRYIADGDEDPFEALAKLIVLVAALAIQDGINPRIMEEELILMVPAPLRFLCVRKFEEIIPGGKTKSYKDLINVHFEEAGSEKAETGKTDFADNDTEDFFEPMLQELKDAEIQRLLLDIDNRMLKAALCGIGRKTAEKIFKNMAEKKGRIIMDEMDHMGTAPYVEVTESRQGILGILYGLIREGEILPGESAMTKRFLDIMERKEEDAEKEAKKDSGTAGQD